MKLDQTLAYALVLMGLALTTVGLYISSLGLVLLSLALIGVGVQHGVRALTAQIAAEAAAEATRYVGRARVRMEVRR